ncbi:MAG: PEP-CTERM sorting domain-containing protein [Syntrophobacteraceae bacterium]|nr:PEP-CTERM sorting domain-containing protein [Syntrophobacteraceae bacterium]
MKRKSLAKFGMALAVAAAVVIWCAPAQAVTFGFDDIWYLSSGTAFSSVVTGASGSASSTGYWQETQTASGGGIAFTRLSNGSGVPGEFVQNTSNGSGLSLTGWTQSSSNKQLVDYVFNVNSTNGYFRYTTGDTGGYLTTGTPTSFTFNSFQLKGGGTYTFVGDNQNFQPIAGYSATVTLNGNWQTFTENWTNVYQIYFTSWPGGSNGIEMDEVHINDPIPEPSTLLLFGGGLVGLAGWRLRKRA